MDSIIKALGKLVKNIRFRFKSSCCDCDSDCNNPVEKDDIEEIIEKTIEKLRITYV